ncbi:MAG: hypothetical protein ABIQ57_17830 [Candidatus Kapaibacterium sp.]
MNRFLLAVAAIAVITMGCGKKADTSKAASGSPADSQSQAAVALVDTSHATPPGNTTTPATAGTTLADSVDLSGAYFPIDKFTGEFSELDFLALATIDENAKPAPLNGFLRPKKQSAKDYHLVAPKVSGSDLTFTTESISGISYSFAGTFTKLGDFSANPPGTDPILKGTLKKMKDGAMVAETPVAFSYSAGG